MKLQMCRPVITASLQVVQACDLEQNITAIEHANTAEEIVG